MKTYTIRLIRHGETYGNEKGQYIGVTDLDLTTNGIKELQEFKKQNFYPSCDMLFASPLKRAVHSAQIIYPEKSENLITIDNLKEMDFGDFEGKTIDELKGREDFINWISGKVAAPPNGEDFNLFVARLANGLREIVQILMDNNKFSASVVMHGGAIMALLAVSAVPRRKEMSDWATGNGRGYTIKITPSLYASSGIIEVTGEIPPNGAGLINEVTEKLYKGIVDNGTEKN